jgi:hypothetical protein
MGLSDNGYPTPPNPDDPDTTVCPICFWKPCVKSCLLGLTADDLEDLNYLYFVPPSDWPKPYEEIPDEPADQGADSDEGLPGADPGPGPDGPGSGCGDDTVELDLPAGPALGEEGPEAGDVRADGGRPVTLAGSLLLPFFAVVFLGAVGLFKRKRR